MVFSKNILLGISISNPSTHQQRITVQPFYTATKTRWYFRQLFHFRSKDSSRKVSLPVKYQVSYILGILKYLYMRLYLWGSVVKSLMKLSSMQNLNISSHINSRFSLIELLLQNKAYILSRVLNPSLGPWLTLPLFVTAFYCRHLLVPTEQRFGDSEPST